MKQTIVIIIVILLFISNTYSQTTYPDNEKGEYEDMLTPKYYLSENSALIRDEINMFIHFAQLESLHHPFEDSVGQIPQYNIHRKFGDGLGPDGTAQHHPAIDYHVGNRETFVNIYAAYSGYVKTYRDAPKYRHYLSLTKNIEDSVGNVIGKMVTLYAHIDLDLDSINNIIIDGQFVNKGDIVSKHLYSGTMGGPHLHFEIRYYRAADIGDESFYGFVGPDGSTTLTEPSAGIWSYGFWNPNIGYGFANPENHLTDCTVSIKTNNLQPKIDIYPNPTKGFITINLNAIHRYINLSVSNLNGQLLFRKDLISTSVINVDLANYNSRVYIIKLIDKESDKTIILKAIKE